MVVICEIDFDNNTNGTYFAGQMVSGIATLKSDKPKMVNAVTLHIRGYADTHWTETKLDKTTEHFSGHEEYFSSKMMLLDRFGSDDRVTIDPGIHSFAFACLLPTTCPSSFEGTHGCVRYEVQVVLVRPWKINQTYTRVFNVLNALDLNLDTPLLREPIGIETQKNFWCWPCSSDPLIMQLSLPQRGYVPGQHIPVDMIIENNSHIAVKELRTTLTMVVCYKTDPSFIDTTTENFIVSYQKSQGVLRNCKKQFRVEIFIPATPPTCSSLSKIINISYRIDVTALVKGHINGVASVPITIGSVPLSNHFERENVITTQPLNVHAFSNDASTNLVPPQSYKEALHINGGKMFTKDNGAVENSQNRDVTSFSPLYPIFSTSSTSNETKEEE